MLHLTADNWDIVIDPEHGSLFRRCHYKGAEIFRDIQDSVPAQFGAGHFPLLPFSNRIENGRFEFDRQTISLPNPIEGQKHILHGFGWLEPWEIASSNPSVCILKLAHMGGAWPWTYDAQQKISVYGSSLKLELSVINRSKNPMPCGLGFHPYFPDLENAWLAFNSDGVWLANEDVLPTSYVISPPGIDFSRPQRLKHYQLDHCFTGTQSADISWKNSDKTIHIESSENLDRAAVYTAHADDCFCFEPISHTHNAINMTDPVSESIRILACGETMTVWSEFTVSV